MSTNNYLPKSKFLIAAALAGVMLAACSPKPESANEVAAQQLVEATQKAEEAAVRAETAQKALEAAQAEQAAAEAKAAADSEQAAADAKLKAAETRAANAEREAAAAKKRAAAAERTAVASKPASTYTEARPAAPAPVCQDCGTVSTITAVKVKGKGTGMGAVAGAIAGVAAGNQVGDGKGTDVAKVVGAIGGAYAGNQAEKYVRSETVFDVSVRMDNGTVRTVRVTDASTVSNGTRVRVSGSNLELM